MIEQTYKTSPKDIFLQLLTIVALYGSAAGFLTLLFQFINLQIPDPLSYGYGIENARSVIRFAVSSLIIVFPVYVWVMRFLARAYTAEPERKEIRIRKWLIYFTLFAAGLIIMGDLVALVNSFLNGELTTRFLLKIFSVFLVAGAVFYYYYWDIKDMVPNSMKLFRWVVMLVVTVCVVAAFFFVGSPKTERMRQFDGQRVNDLQTIQWQIVNYWQQKGVLPTSLGVLEDDISGFSIPRDPEADRVYTYTVKGDVMFELCADFSLASTGYMRGSWETVYTPAVMPGDNWAHDVGHICFERTIDPELYPPQKGLEKPVPAR
ncbi:MAG: hypothetical protein A3J54_01830 [Candidatus Ryanbacteria bacterium RIFCSPHIGHO2_02_FULL_45_13b]|uniref:DUF5671 domain-containing protein n=1 Tax=Candidatus Ryanbacteria bacterium RIFCSPHIGHO2_02_FULL_45_13b TaxID=1802117 RepID=A0A1G2GA67_9BACT|nr:MAG: hypothetical protein A3J54_01830 [Candidatus Ryanbacteria bacterium RIFCSPHIGHO2_02_FULL_45_13b]